MKRKLSLVISFLILILCFAGCGNKKETIKYDDEQLQQYAEMLIGSFSQMDEEAVKQFKDGSDLQVNLMLMQTGLPVEKKEFVSMLEAWRAASDECGDYIKHGVYETEADDKKVILKTEAQYEEREATIEFCFDEKLNIESLDISAKYSTGEILKKAGLNTILGMGTVFAVLIFLAFVISLLKYVPAMTEKFSKKEEDKAEEKVPAVNPKRVREVKSPQDDLELIAVITAAIAAQTGEDADDFVVRSIKRRPSNKWN